LQADDLHWSPRDLVGGAGDALNKRVYAWMVSGVTGRSGRGDVVGGVRRSYLG
jgi:hypothetical protein